MEHRRYVIIQLEEAKRFIQTNRVSYLRLALLLLDNASEIQMYRAVEHELYYNDLYKRMQDNILQILKDHPGSEHDLPETLRDILQMKLLKRER